MTAARATDAADRYLIISADCHGGGSIDGYRDYLDAAWRDEFDAWREQYRNPFRDLQGGGRTRNWDSDRRIEELEADGIVGEVVFPNTVPPFFPTGALIARPPTEKNYARRLAGIRAHNRWLAEWCGQAPERRAGVAQIFLNDVDDAVADVQATKEAGLRGGILLPGVPDDTELLPLYAPEYEPLWAACEELDVPINHHSGGGSPDYGKYPVAGVMWLVETQWFSHRALWHMIMGGVFERHPKLKFIVTEQGCSWIPGTLAMLDGFHRDISAGRAGELKFGDDQVLSRTPSEYFAQNCYVGCSFPSPGEAAARFKVGPDKFMWGSDYPHHEGTYPYTRESLRRTFSSTEPAELRPLLADNAAQVYDFDLDALAPIAARVGPTVDEVAVPLDEIPSDATSPGFYRP